MASSLLWERFDESSNKKLSMYFLRKSADQGDANSNYVMFMTDKNKNGVTKESMRRLSYASNHEHAGAMYELGSAYIDGKYVPRDIKEGTHLLITSACKDGLEAETPITMWLIDKKTELSMKLAYVWALKSSSGAEEGSQAYKEAKQIQTQIEAWWQNQNLPIDSLHNYCKECFESKCYCNFNIYNNLF